MEMKYYTYCWIMKNDSYSGYSCIKASSKEEAISKIKLERPDIVLTRIWEEDIDDE